MADHAYVAFLDILGYRELLAEDVTKGTQDFRDRLIRAFRAFDSVNQSRYNYRAVSDSIFITCADRNASEEFLEVLRTVFVSFLSESLLIRGGVSFGAHFNNQSITYSPVLTKAYLLESTVAEFPRIMIDQNIVEMFPGLLQGQLILRSGENYFLNIVTPDTFNEVWGSAKKACEKSGAILRRNERVRIKHRWLQDLLLESAERLEVPVPPRYLGIFDPGQTLALSVEYESPL